jgi:hypothetical protein
MEGRAAVREQRAQAAGALAAQRFDGANARQLLQRPAALRAHRHVPEPVHFEADVVGVEVGVDETLERFRVVGLVPFLDGARTASVVIVGMRVADDQRQVALVDEGTAVHDTAECILQVVGPHRHSKPLKAMLFVS